MTKESAKDLWKRPLPNTRWRCSLRRWISISPPELRARYERVAAEFETKSQMYWIERAHAKHAEIADAFRKLGEWTDMVDSELLMSAWDDEVLFFYVLMTQFIFAR